LPDIWGLCYFELPTHQEEANLSQFCKPPKHISVAVQAQAPGDSTFSPAENTQETEGQKETVDSSLSPDPIPTMEQPHITARVNSYL